jgi:hypothetical protein
MKNKRLSQSRGAIRVRKSRRQRADGYMGFWISLPIAELAAATRARESLPEGTMPTKEQLTRAVVDGFSTRGFFIWVSTWMHSKPCA